MLIQALAAPLSWGYSAIEISEWIAKVWSCQLHACFPPAHRCRTARTCVRREYGKSIHRFFEEDVS
ncbi:hypothetical protein DKY63_11555 [Pseudomonas putida]|uniref:Uncharacterized protein n=1 Tax=Pseudomonas putida TaxID=303 RepID=A0A2Z4RIH2_PSEPU|nr:hypothetical protein DKY63_11555 [Pseudomonas putida]